MPPNRKEIGSALVSLDLSNHFVSSSKYLPLTAAPTACTEQCQEPTSTPAKSFQKESKQSLSKNEELTQILKAEEARQAVSCDNIVANLINDAPQCAQTSHIITSEGPSDSYWDMPSDESDETVDFSVGQIERNLVEDAVQRIQNAEQKVITAPHVHDKSHPHQSYWDWQSSPVTHEEKTSEIIKTILQEEAIRQLLSIENLSLNESSAPTTKAFAPEVKNLSLSHESSENYWDWSSEEEKVEEAPHVNDSTHPNHQYWDFPSKPLNQESAKKEVIDMILQHEKIRQILCSDTTERREKFSRTQAKRNTSKRQVESSSTMPHQGYWDFHTYTNTPQQSPQEKVKADIINQILREHEAIQATSTNMIIENLENEFNGQGQQRTMVSVSNSEQSSYWNW